MAATCLAPLLACAIIASSAARADTLRYVDQGAAWTAAARAQYYREDQGSRLMPLAWFRALHQPDGRAFLADAMARYGFLPNPDPGNAAGLPVGFSNEPSAEGRTVGMTCSACHVRQISVGQRNYRIDGAPAIIDLQRFFADLDEAVARVLAGDDAFKPFAAAVLADRAADAGAVARLRKDVERWWDRYHLT